MKPEAFFVKLKANPRPVIIDFLGAVVCSLPGDLPISHSGCAKAGGRLAVAK